MSERTEGHAERLGLDMGRDEAIQHMQTVLALMATANGMVMHVRAHLHVTSDPVLAAVAIGVYQHVHAAYELLLDATADERGEPLTAMLDATSAMVNQCRAMWDDMHRLANEGGPQ